MDQQIAEALAEYGDVHIMYNYSGRGMFGEETAAVVAEDFDILLKAAKEAHLEVWDIRDIRSDNMGLKKSLLLTGRVKQCTMK